MKSPSALWRASSPAASPPSPRTGLARSGSQNSQHGHAVKTWTVRKDEKIWPDASLGYAEADREKTF
jgi:hypothetical protein